MSIYVSYYMLSCLQFHKISDKDHYSSSGILQYTGNYIQALTMISKNAQIRLLEYSVYCKSIMCLWKAHIHTGATTKRPPPRTLGHWLLNPTTSSLLKTHLHTLPLMWHQQFVIRSMNLALEEKDLDKADMADDHRRELWCAFHFAMQS